MTEELGDEGGRRWRSWSFVGVSRAAQEIRTEVGLAAKCRASVLITGEPGVGKTRVARLLHHNGSGDKPRLMRVDCADPSDEAFREALLRATTRSGTVFIAPLSHLNAARQALLLGSLDHVNSELRVVSSGPPDLWERVESKKFSEPLYYRLNMMHISIPPLRARPDDVPELLRYFLGSAWRHRRVGARVSRAALRCLVEYAWPGNVDELHHVVHHLIRQRRRRVIQPADLPSKLRPRAARV